MKTSTTAPDRILLVEDNVNLGFLLEELLQSEGYEPLLCRDGDAGWQTFRRYDVDLCLLDVMLPKVNGFHLGRQIRECDSKVPILFLTARSLKADQLLGFEIGADDYICKPFDEEMLLCRIKAILRRSRPKQEISFQPESLSIGNVAYDPDKHLLTVAGKSRRITARENELMGLLFRHPNQVLKREDLLKKVWGENDYFLGRSLDVFIVKLRKYLKEAPHLRIENIFGVGFMLVVES